MQRIGKISVILQLSLLSAFLLIFPSYSFLITNRHQGIIHCLFFSSNCSSGAFSLHHLEPSSSSIHQPLVEPFMEFSSCHHGTFVVIFIIFSLERFSAIHIFFRDSQVAAKSITPNGVPVLLANPSLDSLSDLPDIVVQIVDLKPSGNKYILLK
ncbi:uncharacterized protein LOC106767807 isoform X3 [Vigna radiata var. radiata]|uniref:Uncharacterized protein LOC106767807 isoform X3 n=1 Tax=Vigna radiata var. radiata TaxID=3916 RepID=A0A3Q0F6P9_VIGRR|nr:uncharacterized protein LOC106767807 isoform X3 [Vigna radiata var. radiata]